MEGFLRPQALTSGGRMVKLKKRPTFFLKGERERNLVMVLGTENVSLTAMVACSEQLNNSFLT